MPQFKSNERPITSAEIVQMVKDQLGVVTTTDVVEDVARRMLRAANAEETTEVPIDDLLLEIALVS